MEPLEDYHSPFDFEQGVNTNYLYLSPAYGDTPPSSPAVTTRGTLKEGRGRLGGVLECVCVCEHKTWVWLFGWGELQETQHTKQQLSWTQS